MASKFHGEFEVSLDFVQSNVYETSNLLGAWLVVGEIRDLNYPTVFAMENNRDDAYETLQWCIIQDQLNPQDFDYEIWHVVDVPDWMPESLEVLSIELVEHKDRGNFEETLILVKAWGIPRSGLCVLVTDWGYYTAKDWQGEQPISLRDMSHNYDCIEVTAADGLPTKEIDSFMEFCGVTAGLGYKWEDMRGLKLSRGMLS